jgi:hypothetical protein
VYQAVILGLNPSQTSLQKAVLRARRRQVAQAVIRYPALARQNFQAARAELAQRIERARVAAELRAQVGQAAQALQIAAMSAAKAEQGTTALGVLAAYRQTIAT